MARSDFPGRDDDHEREQPEIQNQQQMNSELAKAFQELARGEQTASALEAKLDGIESRIEELLATFEKTQNQQATESRALQEPKQPTKPTEKP